MSFELPALPYKYTDLEPVISAETFEYHHGKHHNAYVVKLNELVAGTEFEQMTLEEIIQKSSGPMFNQAAQIWNHTFYFNGFTIPDEDRSPSGELLTAIEQYFGSFDAFKSKFIAAGMGNFGSGWTWLVKDSSGKLDIVNTDDAETPLTQGLTPVLTIDVWEHAYYIDYRNARPQYLEEIWAVINWDVVQERFQS